jgi:hypothetical protein
MPKRLLAMAVLAFCLSVPSLGPTADTTKVAVWVKYEGTDTVGTRFAYVLREDISKSARYELFTGTELAPGTALPEIDIVSVDANSDNPGIKSAISIIIQAKATRTLEQQATCGKEVSGILHHEVGVIGSARVDDTAQALMGALDKAMEGVTN